MTATPPDAKRPFDATAPLDAGATVLEASAGTGKTYSITSLVLRLVAEVGVPLPEILVVTFTRAATAELRDRVRRRINDGIVALERALADPGWVPDAGEDEVIRHLVVTGRNEGDEELQLRLRRLSDAREVFDEATISTIHGFCQETLQDSAFESDVDFDAELLENLDELLEGIVHDLVVRELRDADPYWYAHLRCHNAGRDELLGLARRVEAEPYLRIVPDGVMEDPAGVWTQAVERFRRTWRDHGDSAVAWLRQEHDGALSRLKFFREELEEAIDAISEWCDGVAARYRDVAGFAGHLTASALEKRAKDAYVPNPVFEQFEVLCDLGGGPATAFKVRFASSVREELDRRKRARNILSFNDLLLTLQQALERESTRRALGDALRERYAAALIDEFQDTDPVQWSIFETVFGTHGHLYLIGDPKQAIYAFRGADVHTYLRAAGGIEDQATLGVNYRSDARYVEAINDLFERSPASSDGELGVLGHPAIDYIRVGSPDMYQEDRLRYPDGPKPTLRLIHVPRSLAGDKTITKDWAGRHLPDHVAGDIVGFLRSGAVIRASSDAEPEPVKPRHIAVLTRTNAQAQAIQDALQAVGVHAVATGGGSVFESAEAIILQRLLDGLLHPHVERDAKAALTTPLLGVDGTSLVTMPERAWEGWLEQLADWSARWRDHGITQMFRQMADEAGVRARVLSVPGGERRLTNFLHLLELLHAAERADRLGPTALAAWLRERRHDPRIDIDATEIRLESDDDAVKVVTIHRAKGLEYPVVWCPYLWEGNLLYKPDYPNLRFHDPTADGALALDVSVDTQREPKSRNVDIAKQEAWEQNLRLLYVALTRARHQCTVYWGVFTEYGYSPLARVLHGFDRSRPTPKEDDEELVDQVRALVAASEGRIGLSAVTSIDPGPTYEPDDPSEDELVVRPWTRSLDRRWRRASFSSLSRDDRPWHGPAVEVGIRDVDADTEPDDHEAAAEAASGPESVSDAPEVPLARFPRGAGPGTFLHDVLERFDFTRVDEPGELEELVEAMLERHRIRVESPSDVAAGIAAALRTPLGTAVDDARLADVPMDDRLNELPFDLPLLGGYTPTAADVAIDQRDLADVFERHAAGVPIYAEHAEALRELPSRSVRGFLTGSIDLVLRRKLGGVDRYFVVDHKSNWHGDRGVDRTADRSTVAHYHPDALSKTMVEHHYVLQAHLYVVGLHRFLRWRLGESYEYDQHIGGILYLFIRGMIGPETPRTSDGIPHGVFSMRPPRALIDDLDQLLAGTGAGP